MRANKNQPLILIIDDNIHALRSLGELVKNECEVLIATSGEAGIFLAYQRRPDVILTALFIKDLNGIEVCRRLKEMPETRDCGVIVMTPQSSARHELDALEAGAVDFITQPYSPPVVRARIRTHLSLARHQKLLQTLADRDGLTEVYNRRYFEAQARTEIKRHSRQQQPFTLALLDIDHFKAFNDHYGHLHGDACLREVAQEISNGSRRPGEFVARYGGEEFVAVLPNTDARNANKYGRWICERVMALAIPHAQSATVPFVSISVGIVTVEPDSKTELDELLRSADTALYQSKKSGRNQYTVAEVSPSSQGHTTKKRQLLSSAS